LSDVLNILVVCSGNTCRSPVATAVLLNRLLDRGKWCVSSAGTRAILGQRATQYGVDLMNERGIDLSLHRSHALCLDDVVWAHLLLCMEREHVDMVNGRFPPYIYKTHLLSNMVDEVDDVVDPFGGCLQDYEMMIAHVVRLIDNGLERIVELARVNGRLS